VRDIETPPRKLRPASGRFLTAYSWRSARTGSIAAARRAGSPPATIAAPMNTAAAVPITRLYAKQQKMRHAH
jgi:O-antigen/teichoic acid export membrane protein